jgi:hypothetical protein
MPAHPGRSAFAKPGTSSGGWSRGTPPARRPRDETRAPATLVEATFCAIADAGSIPAVSTFRHGTVLLGKDDWYRHVTLRGRVVELDEDALDDIDRLSRHYMGQPYSQRDRRRVSAWIEVETWHAWNGGRRWAGSG